MIEEVKHKQRVRQMKKMYEKYAALLTSGSLLADGGLSVVLTATSAAVAGVGIMLGAATAYIHYRSLQAELVSIEDAEERRRHEIRELEASKAALQKTLSLLNAESKSIDEVTHIVENSFKKVTELQQLVKNFMKFLLDINVIINYTAQHGVNYVYKTVKVKNDLIDPLVQTNLLKDAYDMKTRFLFASKASNIYNAVSSQYISPTLNMLPQLSLMNQATEHEIMMKSEELQVLRLRICSETAALSRQMYEELKGSLAETTRTSAQVFEDIMFEDPELAG